MGTGILPILGMFDVMQKRILKCGIIGYGYMGEIRKGVIERHPQLELVGICDPHVDLTKRAGHGLFFPRADDFFKQPLDVVFVCTPNCFSSEMVIRSLREGKHVFCEKPPGRKLQDIEAIRKFQSHGLKIMFGFNHRWHPGILKAKAMVDSGRFGRILNMRGLYGKSGGVQFKNSWRNNKEVSGGGILLDQGIHMLDLFRFFSGDFEQVKCITSSAFWQFDVEDNAYVILHNPKGIDAVLHSSATFWKHTFRIDITLDGGYITVEGLLSKSGSYGREQLIVSKRQFEDEAHAVGNPAEEITYFDRDLSWELEVREFVNCVLEDRPVIVGSLLDAYKVMELIAKAYQDAGIMSMEPSRVSL